MRSAYLYLFADLFEHPTHEGLELLFLRPFLDCSKQEGVDQRTAVNSVEILLKILLFIEKFGLQGNIVIEGRIYPFSQNLLLEFQLA